MNNLKKIDDYTYLFKHGILKGVRMTGYTKKDVKTLAWLIK